MTEDEHLRPGLPELGPHVITGRLLWIPGDARTKRFQATRQLAATAIQGRFVRGRRLEANEILNQAFDPVAVSFGGGKEGLHWLDGSDLRLQ